MDSQDCRRGRKEGKEDMVRLLYELRCSGYESMERRGTLASAAISHAVPTRDPSCDRFNWLGTYSHQTSTRSQTKRRCRARVKAPVLMCLAAPFTEMWKTTMLSTKAIAEAFLKRSRKHPNAKRTAKSSPMTIWVDLWHNMGNNASGTVENTPSREDWFATIAHSFRSGPP